MKKYIAPSMDVVELEAATLLAGSGDGISNDFGEDTPNGTNFHARSFSVWSEDEVE